MPEPAFGYLRQQFSSFLCPGGGNPCRNQWRAYLRQCSRPHHLRSTGNYVSFVHAYLSWGHRKEYPDRLIWTLRASGCVPCSDMILGWTLMKNQYCMWPQMNFDLSNLIQFSRKKSCMLGLRYIYYLFARTHFS
jgi:hypothetical protein